MSSETREKKGLPYDVRSSLLCSNECWITEEDLCLNEWMSQEELGVRKQTLLRAKNYRTLWRSSVAQNLEIHGTE